MPSLTLTDPDMILPFDGSERESQTPSPPSQLVYLTNLNARYNAAEPHAGSLSSSRPKKNFSRHWTHDDLSTSASRRLSDIGEELSPARSTSFEEQEEEEHMQEEQVQSHGQHAGYYAGHEQGLASSPLLPDSTEKDNASSSSSTVSAGSARGKDVSSQSAHEQVSSQQQRHEYVQPSGLSGSGAASASANVNGHTMPPGAPDSSVIASAAKGKGPGEEFSSAILSSEAERILDNAKKRLTLMEGNLNRARSSVRLTPSPSPSAPGTTSPMGMPAGGLYRSISKTDRRGSMLRRQSHLPSKDVSTNRHSRVHSETNFPPESSLSTDTKRLSRSVSAMGSSSSTYHNDDRSFHYEPTRAYLTHRASISSMKPPYIEQEAPSQEQSPQSPQSGRSPVATHSPVSISYDGSGSLDSPQGLGISSEDESKSTNGGDFSPVYSSYGPPSRAQSQLQVRDLQYQMKGLHIKISSLKVRTQEDNLRRRSLQSLRTPSPLTAADPWFQNALELREGQSSRGSNARRDGSSEYARESRPQSQNPAPSKETPPQETDESPVEQQPQSKRSSSDWQSQQPVYHHEREQSTAQSMYEDAEEGEYEGEIDREALDEILREPLDEDLESSVPHEEREDAFDYEHFILHSALGNFSHQLRRPSNASHESAETTRPMRPVRHSRNNSAMSDSTVATFATATEGEPIPEEGDDIDDMLYWDRRFNHELRHRHAHEEDPIMEETDRSETPRGPRGDDDGEITPVGSQFYDASGRSSSATAGSATPTSLVSSLVSTVRAASASSPHQSSTPTSGGINDDDTQMLEQLFQSLGNVCMDLQAITTSPDPDMKTARVLRRRLDAARRVLDGELDT
ncbi:hypothetical protein N7532_005873 [Penicillium argentinense]|uniref:Uncharacterized protein n=1 Tax=Penicillium argentinense TaxID=1131581 RepID=A0A9W9FF79_9EURO|nr:uncharacterized protein N7532_005873 [Penicillium argentinense]KAJ5098872.1 hypothetical protein N7532_005873 [Penicillium argentinense]